MTAPDPYAAKRALFALFAANTLVLAAGTSDPITPIQVDYAEPAAMQMRCIYGGAVRFNHTDAVAEGVGILVEETVNVGVRVRVVSRPGISVEDNDMQANAIGNAMLSLMKTSTLAAPGKWLGMSRAAGIPGGDGFGTYEQTDDETVSTIQYHFSFGQHVTY